MLLVKSARFSTPLLFLSPPTSSSSFLSYINFSKIFPTAFCTRSESDSLFSTFTKGRLISSFISSSFLPMFSRRLLMLSSTTSFLLFLLPSLFVNIPLTIRGSASFIGSSLTIIDGAAFEWVASSFGSSGSKLPRAKRSSNSSRLRETRSSELAISVRIANFRCESARFYLFSRFPKVFFMFIIEMSQFSDQKSAQNPGRFPGSAAQNNFYLPHQTDGKVSPFFSFAAEK